ncbi:MAG: type I DNA topoisomerase [Bacillati bacterium ANGP1]|uniref:DNA topoisomerase 1 n=1 Tax=Candidatus Segetimicrobium genomatis TaxID=2569760 RepID=A0A537L5C7_9BACT|nr:MAG: type I DNA topoisomerase [Terrabacteria group bacterium ANGP1]
MNKPRAGKEQARAAGAAARPAIPAPQAPSSEIAPPRKRARPASGDGKVTRAGRARALVVVESPTKARTLKKFLDRRYDVVASMGHVKDLPRSRLGVDVANGFAPRYIVIKGKAPILKELKEAAKQASSVYMATDPDREGEAISWHLSDALRAVNPAIKRIEFHEITKEAVLHALARPREIDLNLVNAQQARRVLDRLVGYKLSPLLWRKVRGGLSAGRVQSVAVRLVVDREKEIEAFVPQEYWSIPAQLRKARQPFIARLVGRDGVRYGAPTDEGATVIRTRDQADAIVASLRGVPFSVGEVRRKDQFRHPSPPFTTSTLQQEANHRLGYSAARTMNVAQQLYEGVDLGAEGTVGLITYMRTDSVRVAESAQREAQEYVKKAFGASYLPDAPRVYRSRRSAQDAHEAIRPTSVQRTPDRVKPYLRSDQFKVYKLIWERFLSSQMASAVMDTLSVDIAAGAYQFRATGSRVKFPGFLAVYRDLPENGEGQEGWLPDLTAGETLEVVALDPQQHFTQPPPRYTEASLVRALEERGIGRPSTYAPTIETIKRRGYVKPINRRLHPTDLGKLVNDLLVEHFGDVMDYDFTAAMEEELDNVEEGRLDWQKVVGDFWTPFEHDLVAAEQKIVQVETPVVEIGEACRQCGRPLVRKFGRFGEFIACSGYPECRYTRPLGIGVPCPRCKVGEVVERRSRRGRGFFGCSTYPACTFTSWDRPTDRLCPRCQTSVLGTHQTTRRTTLRCLDKACGYTEVVPAAADEPRAPAEDRPAP